MLFLALASAVSLSPQALLGEARHALDSGRVEEARLLVARAVTGGARGPQLDRTLADIAFTTENFTEAATRYGSLARSGAADSSLLERAGIAALKSGDVPQATRWITQATARGDASWRGWNALGVLADLRRDHDAADAAYAAGLKSAPGNWVLVNNQGWSLLMRGEWAQAVAALQHAASEPSAPIRVRNNLELAKTALDDNLPRRRALESDESWAARLNDAGVVAHSYGDRHRAIAAFTQAIEARSVWFRRAAENLIAAEAYP